MKLVPDCGVLWGIHMEANDVASFVRMEREVGRHFDIDYRYYDIDDEIPDPTAEALVRHGALLHVAIASRDFGAPRHAVTWREVANGEYDESLRAQARGIAGLGVPVFVTFSQEASQQKKFGHLGTGADFKAAWRHLHRLYEEEGATNAVWVWVMTGRPENLKNAARLWPGNDVVDWISWNVYNQSGCRRYDITPSKFTSFEARMRIFYRWVHEMGPRVGIDERKPMMISEYGSAIYPNDPETTARWYASIPNVLKRYPQIKAVQMWDSSSGGCDYRLTQSPQVLKSFADAGVDPSITGVDVRRFLRDFAG